MRDESGEIDQIAPLGWWFYPKSNGKLLESFKKVGDINRCLYFWKIYLGALWKMDWKRVRVNTGRIAGRFSE